MSEVSGVGQGLFQYLRSVSANSQTSSTTSATSATDAQAASIQGTQRPHRGHPHGSGAMFKKVEQAVTDALQSAQSSSSTSTTDPNKAIEDALVKLFQNSNSSSATASAADPTASSKATAQTAAANSSDQQQFFQMLKDNGIDPKQFRQDLVAAMQQAQSGTVNPSTAFASFPPGTAVDTSA